ncbi:MAG TPA: periplasmic heavy metal sensor [Candidatus Brocadiia bacterium]|nr:periplasmic heavy metal sensor [Candidatus Brocadiia bacterium]
MSKTTRWVVLGCFVAAFAAGVAAGVALFPPPAPPPPGSWLTHELDLTPEQRTQMRQIWSGVMGGGRGQRHVERQALEKERDEAIQALLTEEQKARYDEVMKSFSAKVAAQAEERKKAFDDAVESTKKILNEKQRAKYEEILKQRGGRGRRGPPGPPPDDGGGPEPPPPSGAPASPKSAQ